jgi:hypothetical protein
MRIDEAFNMLNSAYNDWSHALINPLFYRSHNTISWDNFERIYTSDPVRPEEFIRIIEGHQYSLQMAEDGAVLQLFYAFANNGRTLINASLGYYRSFDIPSFTGDIDGVGDDYIEDMEDNGPNSSNTFVTGLRIDYAPEAARGIIHSCCHMHISGFPGARLVVGGVPTPKQFVEFIIATFYPSLYEKHRLDIRWNFQDWDKIRNINRPSVTVGDIHLCNHVIHFKIPSYQ